MCGSTHFCIGAIGFHIMREHAFPIGLLICMNGCPMPVFDHVGPVGEVCINIFAELTIIRWILERRSPIRCLGVGLGHQKIAMFERASEICLNGLISTVVLILYGPVV